MTNNKHFNVSETTSLTTEALKMVTEDEWKKVVDHTKKVVDNAFDKEGILEQDVIS